LNSTKHLKRNENYNKILEKPFNFILQTLSTARHRCRSSLSRPNVVCCIREVAERVKKITSVPEMKKKDELPMKLHDDLKIATSRQNS
jgi:ppGpp synthetase/RelA/SpoT-type nucleotidyltranferase